MPLIPKNDSWFKLLCDMPLKSELEFPAENERSVRAMISGRLKKKYPLRQYGTTVVADGNGVKYALTVTRKSDLIPAIALAV